MKHTAVVVGILSALALLAPPEVTAQDNLERCIKKALSGPGPKLDHVEIYDHHFHCYPATVVQVGPTTRQVSGRLDHDIASFWGARPDDKVYYSFVTEKGTVRKNGIDVRISKGGIIPILAPAAAALLEALADVKISSATAAEVLRTGAKTMTGRGWDDVAGFIVQNIAIRAALK
jgi:hypothetical protein